MANNRYKIVLLGEGRVGKTSLLLRFTKGEYSDRQVSTVQASYLDKKINVGPQAVPVQLSVWDTAGQERFHALGPIYYRDADGAMLVYDITDAESFNKVQKWVKELRKIVGNDINIAIAGNKCDLEKNRSVVEADALKYAESVNACHYHTSAKANRGVDEVFAELGNRMNERRKKSSGGASSSAGAAGPGGGGSKQKIVIMDDVPKAKEKGGCC